MHIDIQKCKIGMNVYIHIIQFFFCTSFLLVLAQENICLRSLFLWNTQRAASLAVILISPLACRVREWHRLHSSVVPLRIMVCEP